MDMNWQQKMAALNALCEHQLLMRQPLDWYVHGNKEIKDGAFLIGCFGEGGTPEEAVENDWDQFVTDLAADKYIVTRADDATRRRAVRWNGFMWQDVAEKEAA